MERYSSAPLARDHRFPLLNAKSLMRSVRAYRQLVPGFRLLAGTGTPSLSETIDLTKLAFELGYDGVVVVPPYYFRNV